MNTPWAGRFLWALAVVEMGTVAGQDQARVQISQLWSNVLTRA
jgi:hypothetical protein